MPPEFFESDEISNFLNDLNELRANSPSKTNTENKIIFANAYGYIVPLEIPKDMDNTSISLRASGGEDDKTICTCNTSGDCPKKSKLGVIWCDAENCTSCTMSGIATDGGGNEKHLLLSKGKITLSN